MRNRTYFAIQPLHYHSDRLDLLITCVKNFTHDIEIGDYADSGIIISQANLGIFYPNPPQSAVVDPYCKIAKQLCIVEATEKLPTHFGGSFYNTLNSGVDR